MNISAIKLTSGNFADWAVGLVHRADMTAAVPDTGLCRSADERPDDLSRKVFGLLGLTLDALDFELLLRSIGTASGLLAPYLISTPNVNFLVTSRRNLQFRDLLLRSDLCIADGMPLIWIARLLRIPINERITGGGPVRYAQIDTGSPAPSGFSVWRSGRRRPGGIGEFK